MNRVLFGAGGCAHDIWANTGVQYPCYVDKKYWEEGDSLILPVSEFDPMESEILVAVANPKDRQFMVERLPEGTVFWSFIHSTVFLSFAHPVCEGSFVAANSILVYNNIIGKHAQINIATTIGHDTQIGDYFTSAPQVAISGDCKIGNRVYFGTHSSCKQKVTICDDVTIGMGAVVLNDITKPGTYVGCPARRINQ